MIYPSIAELTNDNKINRYTLVVATAKCARIITDEYVKQREYAEKIALNKDADKKISAASIIKREYRDEKAVKTAISGLYNGEFKLVSPDGSTQLIGRGTKNQEAEATEENADEAVSAEEVAEDAQ